MAIPGDRTHRVIRAIDSAGDPVTGLVIGDLSISAYRRETPGSWGTYTATPALEELGAGLYGLSFDLPPNPAWWDVRVAAAAARLSPAGWQGQTIATDLDRLAALIARPVAILSAGASLGAELPLSIVANRTRTIAVSVTDQTGAPLDLSGYTNWRIGVRTLAGLRAWESGIGTHKITGLTITGNASGLLTVTFPENLSLATAWASTTAYALGDVVRGASADLPAICVQAGTSGGSEPTWPAAPGDPISDGSAEWRMLADPATLAADAVAAGQISASARYEITGDAAGDPAKTTPIIRSSTLQIFRDEVATLYQDPSA